MKPLESTVENPRPFLTTEDLGRRWKTSRMFIHRIRTAGRLPAYRIGKRGVRFALADVLRIESEAHTAA